MRKFIFSFIAVISFVMMFAACDGKSTTVCVENDSTAVDSIVKDSTIVDSAKVDSVVVDSIKVDSTKILK